MTGNREVDPGSLACPIPISQYPQVLLAHGGGGALTRQLLEKLFLPAFSNPELLARHDGAVFGPVPQRLAFTTDSYVVRPLFFPGGDIGSLAINGTANDLAMCGARPRWLSAGFILEEGLAMDCLWRVVQSMARAAAAAGVFLVTGDTKVVERGKGDAIFITTAGVGVLEHDQQVAPATVRAGDVIVLSGDLGRHGIAIMAERENLAFETAIESDCAPLVAPVMALFAAGVEVHCLRDLTRGGLASAAVEIAGAAGLSMHLEERDIPVSEAVQGACELLGFDPLYVANEGRFVTIVPPREAERTVRILRQHGVSREATIVGTVREGDAGVVTLTSRIGATRIVDLISGEQLPRIC